MKPLTCSKLSAMARLVRLIESWPDPDDTPSPVVEDPALFSGREGLGEGETAAVKRTDLRDRMGRIITLDRAGTSRSISVQSPTSNI